MEFVFALKFVAFIGAWLYIGQLGYKLSKVLYESNQKPHRDAGCEAWENWHRWHQMDERAHALGLIALGPITIPLSVGLWVLTEIVKSVFRFGALLYRTFCRRNRLSVF